MKPIVINTTVCELNLQEKKIRKNWLILTLLRFIAPFAVILLFWQFFTPKEQHQAVKSLTVCTLLGSISLWMLLHYAYKKHETAFLLFSLICVSIQSVFFLITALCSGNSLEVSTTITVQLAFTLPWFLSSLKLRKLNKEIQINILRNSITSDYLESMKNLEKAKNLEELHFLFFKITETWPKLDKYSSKEYALLKSKFSES